MGKTLMLLAMFGLLTASQIGCRACGSPYDYASPLATCGCSTDSCDTGYCDTGACDTGACESCNECANGHCGSGY